MTEEEESKRVEPARAATGLWQHTVRGQRPASTFLEVHPITVKSISQQNQQRCKKEKLPPPPLVYARSSNSPPPFPSLTREAEVLVPSPPPCLHPIPFPYVVRPKPRASVAMTAVLVASSPARIQPMTSQFCCNT